MSLHAGSHNALDFAMIQNGNVLITVKGFKHIIHFVSQIDYRRLHVVLQYVYQHYTYSGHVVDEHVPEGAPSGQAFFTEELAKRAEDAVRERYEKKLGDLKNYSFVIKNGSPDIEIIRFAKKNDIDVIVMGALGKSEQDRLIHGSTVANVSKYAHCHVIAIRNPAKGLTLPGTMN